MTEILSSFIGAVIALIGAHLLSKNDAKKAARYLAIRVVCIFDKYLEDCVSVVKDDGLSHGQRTPDGCLEPQEASPGAPIFPDDIDWKTIDHNLMYEILSLPSDVEAADRAIAFNWEVVASPPDFDEYFEERAFHYAQFGLRAYNLATKLRKKYKISAKDYKDWNPVAVLEEELKKIRDMREKRARETAEWLKTMPEKADGN